MKKKLFTVLFISLAVLALACAFAACVSSDDIGDPDDLTYMKQGDEYVVTGIGGYDGSNLVIPAKHNGLPVTSIDDYAFFNCKTITELSIPDTVTYIGDYAFYYCNYIKSVNIPKNLEYIGDYSFYKCTALENIRYDTVALENSYDTIFNYAGERGNGIIVTIGKGVTEIPDYMFYMTSTREIVWEDGGSCTIIGRSAFNSCTQLADVAIPEGVTTIVLRAFRGCTGLKNVVIPSTITSIGLEVFSGCTSIKSVYAADLDSWCNISFDNSTSSPLNCGADLYFDNNLVTDLNFSDDVTSIGQYSFSGCTSLKSVTIPESVTSIDSGAFYNCTALEEIYFNAVLMEDLSSDNYVFYRAGQSGTGITVMIGKYVTKIPAYLFYPFGSSDAPKITSLNFEEGSMCASIGSYAFWYCGYLTSVTIPACVTSIGNYAFYDCTGITEIYFNAESMNDLSSLNRVFNDAGQSGSGITLTIGSRVTKIPAYLFDPYSSSSSSPRISTVIFEKDSQCSSIGSHAFDYCSYITAVYYSGTAEEWSAMSISLRGNSYLTNATRYYYSEEEPSEDGNYWHYVDGEIVVWTKED